MQKVKLMKNETTGNRILLRRKTRELTQKQLAGLVKVSHVAISQWEKDETLPRGENLLRLAEALECAPAYLIDGEGPIFDRSPAVTGFSAIPLIALADVQQWAEGKRAHFEPVLSSERVLSEGTFAVRIEDHAMTPAYLPGDVVIIDPLLLPLPGDTVLAFQSDIALLRTYRPRGKIDDVPQFELAPANIDYPVLRSHQEKLQLAGTIIELRRYRQR